jgi:hypothetical protein
MPQNSKGDAILQGKCPRCRQGSMFVYPFYKYFKSAKVNENCPVCHLRFEIEPGFFFGAMYISYAFSVALFATIGVALSVLGDYPVYYYIISIVVAEILLFPLMFRYSRILFLHLFGGVRYDPGYAQRNTESGS